MIFNTRERAVSTDINRAQSFIAKDGHEFDRHLVNREIAGDFYNFPGMQAPYTALPPSSDFLIPHDCVSGLMARPDNATGLLIDPGEAAFFVPAFPNATADDSKYVYVSSAGVSSISDLPFTANPGPGVRWDIIECQPTEALLESASRDTYDPSNGQFTAGVVPKVRAGTLSFRVRSGAPGGGIPNPDSAWMPLAAVHVRTDATGFNNCDVYDIRPLVNERCPWSPSHPKSLPASATESPGFGARLYEAQLGQGSTQSGVGRSVRGMFRGHFGGYWSGGLIQRNTPSPTLADFGETGLAEGSSVVFDPKLVDNQSSAFSIAGDDRFTIGAFFPRGYPRWVRYSQNPLSPSSANHLRKAGRFPNGSRGILWVAKDAARSNGVILPNAPPTVLGETENCWGHVVSEGATDGATDFYPAYGSGSDGKFYHTPYELQLGTGATPTTRTRICSGLNLASSVIVTNGAGTLTSIDFPLHKTYPIPRYAKAAYVTFLFGFTFAGPDYVRSSQAMITRSGSSVALRPSTALGPTPHGAPTTPDDAWVWNTSIWIPLSSDTGWDSAGSGETWQASFLFNHTAAPTFVSGLAFLDGYQI